MESNLAEKLEALEAQLPRWEKWLYVCYGASTTMFINALARAAERSYLQDAFDFTAQKLEQTGTSNPFISDPVFNDISHALSAPWWLLACYGLLLAMLIPGAFLALHSPWRKVPIHKRSKLIYGFFISAWLVLLSMGAADPYNVFYDYNYMIIGSAIVIATSYWWLRRKKDRAEEVFP